MKRNSLGTILLLVLVNFGRTQSGSMKHTLSTPPPKAPDTPSVNKTLGKDLTSSQTCKDYPPSDFDVCPDGFTYVPSSKGLCYTIKEAQPFPPKCDYPNVVPFHLIKPYLSTLQLQNGSWINVFRNNTSGFAHLEWIENGKFYGTTYPYHELLNPNDYDKNCVIFKHGQLIRVSCTQNYDTVCFYSSKYFQTTDLVNICKAEQYEQCIIADYDLVRPQCFCTKIDARQPDKNEFCSTIAEPTLPHQSKLLQTYLQPQSSACWVGFYKQEEEYKWFSTKEKVSYTWWASPEDCSESEGAYLFSKPPFGGWVLAQDRTLNCAICAVELILQNCSLELAYNSKTGKIDLVVDNEASISKLYTYDLHCFSDSNSDDFKKALIEDDPQYIGDIVKFSFTLTNHPSYYWCEAFQYNSHVPVRSNVIVGFNSNPGYANEFSVLVEVKEESGTDPFSFNYHTIITGWINDQLRRDYRFIQYVRPMRGYLLEGGTLMRLIVHITTCKSTNSLEKEHGLLLQSLKMVVVVHPVIKVVDFASSDVCFASTTYTSDNQTLTWPSSRLGVAAIPQNTLCLDEKHGMIPVRRKCEGDFLTGAKWGPVLGDCYKTTTYSGTTVKLFDLLSSNASTETYEELKALTDDYDAQNSVDVFLVASIIKKVVGECKENANVTTFSSIIDNLMYFNGSILRESQILLNATDQILSSVDEFFNDVKPDLTVSRQLITQISSSGSNVIGLALYKSGEGAYTVTTLYKNTSIETILSDVTLDLAVFLPAHKDVFQHTLAIKVFHNDVLFNEISHNPYETGKIVSVSVSGVTDPINYPVTIAMNLNANYTGSKNCSHWKYGIGPQLQSVQGRWVVNNRSRNNSNLEICEYYHMTHFGLLLQGSGMAGKRNVALEILIGVGSALSLVGVIPIFLSAFLFKSWINRTGNIILINFCVCISTQSALTLLLYSVRENGILCVTLGALLHYTDLSEFCFMFVIAFLQYLRFVRVFNHPQKSMLGKSLLIGWALPLIPVVVVLAISPSNYRLNSYGYCYVVGAFLFYGSLMPILLILVVNTIIFFAIMWSIRWRRRPDEHGQKNNCKLEILLAVFLFFSLGLTWFFGLAGVLVGATWLTYVFCALTSIRGLILFLFFIIGNKELRVLWEKRFRYFVRSDLQESSIPRSTNSGTVSNE